MVFGIKSLVYEPADNSVSMEKKIFLAPDIASQVYLVFEELLTE